MVFINTNNKFHPLKKKCYFRVEFWTHLGIAEEARFASGQCKDLHLRNGNFPTFLYMPPNSVLRVPQALQRKFRESAGEEVCVWGGGVLLLKHKSLH